MYEINKRNNVYFSPSLRCSNENTFKRILYGTLATEVLSSAGGRAYSVRDVSISYSYSCTCLATGFTIGKNLTGQKLVNGTKGTQLTRSTIHLNRLFVRHEDGKPACSKIGTPPLAETQHACLQFRETGHGQQRPLACLNPDTNIFYHHLARV